MTHDSAAILLSLALVTTPCLVTMMAVEHGVDPALALQMVALESEWDQNAKGDGGAALGLWQWHGKDTWDTWAWACELTGYPQWSDDALRADPVKSTIVALEMINRGYGHLWTSYRVLQEERDQ